MPICWLLLPTYGYLLYCLWLLATWLSPPTLLIATLLLMAIYTQIAYMGYSADSHSK